MMDRHEDTLLSPPPDDVAVGAEEATNVVPRAEITEQRPPPALWREQRAPEPDSAPEAEQTRKVHVSWDTRGRGRVVIRHWVPAGESEDRKPLFAARVAASANDTEVEVDPQLLQLEEEEAAGEEPDLDEIFDELRLRFREA